MKQKLLLLMIALSSFSVRAQCEELATNFGNNSSVSSYNITGDVTIVYQNNQITFKTGSNFSTASGPDVRVYLVNSEGKTDQQLISTSVSNMPNIPFGLIDFSGAQEITIDAPTGVDLENYDTVYFYCFQFSAFWDFGKIDLTSFNECSLSIKSLDKVNSVSIYPNPVNNKIFIDGNISNYSAYKLLDLQGRLIKQSNKISSSIDVSDISKGVYTLFFSSNNVYEVEKIIIK